MIFTGLFYLFILFFSSYYLFFYSLLHLRQPILEFKSSVFRSNLFYDIQFKELLDDPFINLCEFIEETKNITNVYISFFLIDH
jgi:hypothetical protein